jgi:TPR repeat protein
VAQREFEERLSAECNGGNAEKCLDLGLRYADRTKARFDPYLAVPPLTKACEGGLAVGCHSLGILYAAGWGHRGVPQNFGRAAELFERACEGGDNEGCLALGRRYLNGEGVPQDERRAAELFEKVCKGGYAKGCDSLAEQQQLAQERERRAQEEQRLAPERERRAKEEQRLAQEREKRAQEEQRLAQRARAQRVAAFRKALKVGDSSHCGLVIEVKPPIAKIQTMAGERWLKIEQLYGEGDAPCRFINGVYQEP